MKHLRMFIPVLLVLIGCTNSGGGQQSISTPQPQDKSKDETAINLDNYSTPPKDTIFRYLPSGTIIQVTKDFHTDSIHGKFVDDSKDQDNWYLNVSLGRLACELHLRVRRNEYSNYSLTLPSGEIFSVSLKKASGYADPYYLDFERNKKIGKDYFHTESTIRYELHELFPRGDNATVNDIEKDCFDYSIKFLVPKK